MVKVIIWMMGAVPLWVYSMVSYGVTMDLGEKNTSSPFSSEGILFVSPFRMVEEMKVQVQGEKSGMKGETTWCFRWQTEKDPLYEHEWVEGKRDFRAFPEEVFVEGMYSFRLFFLLGKKKWDMSEGFFFKPMLLWDDYEAYKRYGEGFYFVRGEVKCGGFRLSLYAIPPRVMDTITNRWYDCFQNGITNWLWGGAFSFLVEGWVIKGISLWEVPSKGGGWLAKYAFSTALSLDKWTWYAEMAYKNGRALMIPRFEGKEITNVYGMMNEFTNIVPAEYIFEEMPGSYERMFFEGLVGFRWELPSDITLRGEVYYRERSWGEDEREHYWNGVAYAKERLGNTLSNVADISKIYLLQAAGNLSLDTYSSFVFSAGLVKGFGDHWSIDQNFFLEMGTFSWRWSGTIVWKSFSLWEVKATVMILGGGERSFFWGVPEGKKMTLELTSTL